MNMSYDDDDDDDGDGDAVDDKGEKRKAPMRSRTGVERGKQ